MKKKHKTFTEEIEELKKDCMKKKICPKATQG